MSKPRITFDDWNTDKQLLGLIKQYAREVVDEYDMDVDFDKIVRWEINGKKRTAGQVKSYKLPLTASIGDSVSEYNAKTEIKDVESFGECVVEFSRRAFNNNNEEQAKSHVRHELIHIEQVQNHGTGDHGRGFKRKARELDTSVHCENFVPYKYKFKCNGCGDVVDGRYRECKMVRKVRNKDKRSPCCYDSKLSIC
jgi:hypothetical protein